jgi:putative acetyltransferase
MKKIIYRKIEKKDNKAIAFVIRTVLEEYGVDQPGTVYTDPTTDLLYELFQEKNSFYLITETDNTIIGGCGLFPTKGLPNGCIELVKFYVNSSHRNKGIGSQLMKICLEKARELQFSSVYLESLPELDAAVNMYEANGFQHIPERLGESGHFACSIIMLKTL